MALLIHCSVFISQCGMLNPMPLLIICSLFFRRSSLNGDSWTQVLMLIAHCSMPIRFPHIEVDRAIWTRICSLLSRITSRLFSLGSPNSSPFPLWTLSLQRRKNGANWESPNPRFSSNSTPESTCFITFAISSISTCRSIWMVRINRSWVIVMIWGSEAVSSVTYLPRHIVSQSSP